MPKLVFDIETIGENFDTLDDTTKESLTRWIKKESSGESEYETALEDLKNGLGFSPLTGEIVAIGVLDLEKDQGVVYFSDPSGKAKEAKFNNFSLKPTTEKEMLESFWQGAKNYTEFISFNGRAFDVPFLTVRSAIHKIRPTRDLMEGRYLYQQRSTRHIDLLDQLTFYGASRRKGNLHLWSRAFSIKSPKSDGVSGDEVGQLFKAGKCLEIAKYNVGDLIATGELYKYWEKFLKF
ncbi:MAG: Uncharacterized protein G01um101420_420 [Parcubacteria group bacterium Gr01-1014_20]|nr:MAG: Uncharacterized protein G01um101420_420 [Parcubacteria group bacterium Gr01-1014_20]